MTPELMYLVWSAALTLVLAVIAVSGATLEVGLPKLAGNREGMAEMPGWAGRAARATATSENLVLFAILVFAARIANVSTAMTVLGAQRSSLAAWPTPSSTLPASPGCARRPGWCR